MSRLEKSAELDAQIDNLLLKRALTQNKKKMATRFVEAYLVW
jgi:hypothetical protein